MIATSTTQTIPFTPPWLCREDDRTAPLPGSPVFHLRAAGVMERSAFEAELSGWPHNAGRVTDMDLRRALREGVERIFAGDPECDRIIEAINAEEDAIKDAIEAGADVATPLPDEQANLLVEVRKVMATVPGDYAELSARLIRRNQILPVLSVHRFCVAWDGYPKPLTRNRIGLIDDAALREIGEYDLMAAGLRAYALQWVGDQAGNSSQASTSDDGLTTSSSGAPPSAAGKSAKRTGKKTPA